MISCTCHIERLERHGGEKKRGGICDMLISLPACFQLEVSPGLRLLSAQSDGVWRLPQCVPTSIESAAERQGRPARSHGSPPCKPVWQVQVWKSPGFKVRVHLHDHCKSVGCVVKARHVGVVFRRSRQSFWY